MGTSVTFQSVIKDLNIKQKPIEISKADKDDRPHLNDCDADLNGEIHPNHPNEETECAIAKLRIDEGNIWRAHEKLRERVFQDLVADLTAKAENALSKKDPKALDYIKEIMSYVPNRKEELMLLARFYLNVKEGYDKAKALLKEIATDPKLKFAATRMIIEEKGPDEALIFLREVRINSIIADSPEILGHVERGYPVDTHYPRLLPKVKKALNVPPDKKLNDADVSPRQTQEVVRTILEKNPDQVSIGSDWSAGLVYLVKGAKDRDMKILGKALEIWGSIVRDELDFHFGKDLKYREANLYLGRTFLEMAKIEQKPEYLKKAGIALNRANTRNQEAGGNSDFFRGEEYSKAEALLMKQVAPYLKELESLNAGETSKGLKESHALFIDVPGKEGVTITNRGAEYIRVDINPEDNKIVLWINEYFEDGTPKEYNIVYNLKSEAAVFHGIKTERNPLKVFKYYFKALLQKGEFSSGTIKGKKVVDEKEYIDFLENIEKLFIKERGAEGTWIKGMYKVTAQIEENLLIVEIFSKNKEKEDWETWKRIIYDLKEEKVINFSGDLVKIRQHDLRDALNGLLSASDYKGTISKSDLAKIMSHIKDPTP